MTCEFEVASTDSEVFRLGYGQDAWSWPPWQYTGKGRWDSPDDSYRVLYASTARLAPFMETLASLQPEPALEAQLLLIDVGVDESWRPGRVPADWLDRRSLGCAFVRGGKFAHLGHSKSLAFLKRAFRTVLSVFDAGRLDAGDLRDSSESDRRLTQRLSQLVHACRDGNDQPEFNGIYYESRLGDEFDNWAVFEPFVVQDRRSEAVPVDDSDFREAVRRLGLSPP